MTRFVLISGCILALCIVSPHSVNAADVVKIVVDTGKPAGAMHLDRLGLNVNYLVDDDANRPEGAVPLAKAIQSTGAKFLRYPGGNKSDSYLWSVPPYDKPRPTPALSGDWDWPAMDKNLMHEDRKRYKTDPLDFDEFMALCKATKAEPVVVICYDALHQTADEHHDTISRERLLETAVAWVRYCKEKNYRVRWWEIGNETYFSVSAEAYAKDLVLFSRAMKAVDPDILIGANGPTGTNSQGDIEKKNNCKTPWWKSVLETASSDIDFLSVHDYPCWKWMDFNAYARKKPDFAGCINQVEKAIRQWAAPEDRKRLRIAMTETNAADWFGHPEQKGWPHDNTLGHALVLFDLLGDYAARDDVAMTLVWNTRWIHNERETPELWDAFSPANTLNPTGRAMAIWAEHGLPNRLSVDSPKALKVYATSDQDGKRLSLFVINRETRDANASLQLKGSAIETLKRYQWTGEKPTDATPEWRKVDPLHLTDGFADLHLPPNSLTVLTGE